MAEKKYPRISFREKIKDIKNNVEKASQKTLDIYRNAIKVLQGKNEKTAEKIIESSERMDDILYGVEKACINLIATEQPLASDLRFIESCIKIGTHLKRVGYLSADIAEAVAEMKGKEKKIPKKIREDILHMADYTEMMLSKAIYSFLDQNSEMAEELDKDDDKVDDLFDKSLEHIAESISKVKNKESIYCLLRLILIARYLERIADQAVSIGHRTVFMVRGKRAEREESA